MCGTFETAVGAWGGSAIVFISVQLRIGKAQNFNPAAVMPETSKWDFRLSSVQSINASGHKFGLVPPGLGWVVFRERKIFNEDLIFYVNYLAGEVPTATLNFSRGASRIAVQAFMMLRLGGEGYTQIMRHTLDNAIHQPAARRLRLFSTS